MNTTNAQKYARFIARDCRDMLMGLGDGGMFIQAIESVANDALANSDLLFLTGLADRLNDLCRQWLDEWADHDSQVTGFYAGIIAVLDDQDSGLPMDGLRLAAAKALIAFDAERLRHLYDRLAA